MRNNQHLIDVMITLISSPVTKLHMIDVPTFPVQSQIVTDARNFLSIEKKIIRKRDAIGKKKFALSVTNLIAKGDF